jgi:hypothetical protein
MNKTSLIFVPLFIPLAAYANSPLESVNAWEVRYVLIADSVRGFQQSASLASAENREALQLHNGSPPLNAAVLFKPTAVFNKRVAVALIEFDRNGHVIGNDALAGFSGRHGAYTTLVLFKDKPYYFADWYVEPEPSHFMPALCTQRDYWRYTRPWNYESADGGFGCREWTAQLYRKERPYIDVTTYGNRRNFIGKFIGWARFEDAPKPVIGSSGKTWLCLHDCPAGEKPGIIPDIRAWTRKHGFPVPVAPAIQPEYPNTETED